MKDGKRIASSKTGPDGFYKFDNLPAGDYTVTVTDVPKGFTHSAGLDNPENGTVAVKLGAGENRDDVDIGFVKLGSIGDFIFNDANGDGKQAGDSGLEGVAVTLMKNGTEIASTKTGPDGSYKFDKLPAGEYTVKVSDVPSGFNHTAGLDNPKNGTVAVKLGAGEKRDDVDIGFAKLGSIGDFIYNDANGDGKQANESGLEGVTVTLMKDGKEIASTKTGPDGSYKFDKLPAGEYTVKVSDVPSGFNHTAGLDNPK